MAKPAQYLTPIIGPSDCGGVMRVPERGAGVISGTTKELTITSPCKVWLYQESGMLMGFRRTEAGGTYSFVGLPLGYYFLVVADDQQALRSKVEHVIVT
ncbi:MAG: hypothetical protein LCH59_00560 [Proteobacteria bacterium]|nr:hypothetical protein [Pseudomonadota bacterium]